MNKEYSSIQILDKIGFFLAAVFLFCLFILPASSLMTMYSVTALFITFNFWSLSKDSNLYLPLDWPSITLYAFAFIQFLSVFWAQHISIVWPVAFDWFLLCCLYIIIRNVNYPKSMIKYFQKGIACLIGLNVLMVCGSIMIDLIDSNFSILFSTEFLIEVTNSLNTSQNFLSSLMVLLLPYLLYILNHLSQGLVIKMFVVLLYVFIISIFQSKAAILAIFAIIFSYLIFGADRKGVIFGGMVFFGGLFGIALLVMLIPNEFLDVNEYNPIYPLLNKTGDDRLLIWLNSWEIIKQHYFLGVGAGNWGVVHLQFGLSEYNASLRYTQAHNFLLQTITETGWIGFLLLVNIFACPFYYFFKKRDLLNSQAGYLLLGLIGFFILSSFYGVGYWYSFLAMFVGFYGMIFKGKESLKKPFPRYLLILFALVGGSAMSYLVGNHHYKKVRIKLERNKPNRNIKLFKAELAHIPILYEFKGTQSLQGRIAKEYYELGKFHKADRAYDEALKQSPFDVALLLGKAKVSIKLNRYEVAKDVSLRAIELDKRNESLHLQLFRAAIATKDVTRIHEVKTFFEDIITTKDEFYDFYLDNVDKESIADFWDKRCEHIDAYLSLLEQYQIEMKN